MSELKINKIIDISLIISVVLSSIGIFSIIEAFSSYSSIDGKEVISIWGYLSNLAILWYLVIALIFIKIIVLIYFRTKKTK
jgi:hypothetical protein